jgi:hypothetical protein
MHAWEMLQGSDSEVFKGRDRLLVLVAHPDDERGNRGSAGLAGQERRGAGSASRLELSGVGGGSRTLTGLLSPADFLTVYCFPPGSTSGFDNPGGSTI